MSNKKHHIKMRISDSKDKVISLLSQYNYYEYAVYQNEISESTTLLVLEYRSGFRNVYQSITIVVTECDRYCEVFIYESKSTTSVSDLLTKRKEIERMMNFITEHGLEIYSIEES